MTVVLKFAPMRGDPCGCPGRFVAVVVLVDGSQAFQCALCTTKVTTPNISKSGWFVTSIGWYFEFSGRKYSFGYIFHSLLSVHLFPSLATTICLWAAVTDRSTTITSPGRMHAPIMESPATCI